MQSSYEINVPEILLKPKLSVAPANPAEETVRILITLGADINAEDCEGRTPLQLAVKHNNIPLIDILLENNADINYVSSSGTAMHHAAAFGSVETVKHLLSRGAMVDSIDRFYSTPLHIASKKGYVEIIEILLDKGAKPDSENSIGCTPLDLAASCGSIDVFELFDRKGVDLCSSESKGFRLLSIAVECKNDPLALWLLSKEANLNHVGRRSLFSRFLPASVSLCISMCFCACLPFLMY